MKSAKVVNTDSDTTSLELNEQTGSLEEIKQAIENLTSRSSNIFTKVEEQMEATDFLHHQMLKSFNFANELSNISSALKFLTKKYRV